MDFEQHMRPEDAKRYAMGSNPTLSWFGLSRYWTKHAAANSATQDGLLNLQIRVGAN